MSKPDTWMPLYVGDYLRDTTRLTTEQHGAYLLLIMDYWTNGPLPDDDSALAQVTRLQPVAWKRNRAAIARLFHIADGEWHHKRIDEELHRAQQFIAKQKANGSKGGRPKKNPDNKPDESQKKPMGSDGDIPGHNPDESPSPSPSPNPLGNVVDDSTVVSAADDERPRHPAKGDPFPMTLEWQPSQHFPEICRQAGMAGAEEDQAAIAEFRTYWLSRDAAATQHEWDHKLLTNLQRVRIRAKADAAAAKANDAAPKAPSRDAGRMAASTTSLEAALSGGTRNRNGGHDGRVIEANAATRMD